MADAIINRSLLIYESLLVCCLLSDAAATPQRQGLRLGDYASELLATRYKLRVPLKTSTGGKIWLLWFCIPPVIDVWLRPTLTR